MNSVWRVVGVSVSLAVAIALSSGLASADPVLISGDPTPGVQGSLYVDDAKDPAWTCAVFATAGIGTAVVPPGLGVVTHPGGYVGFGPALPGYYSGPAGVRGLCFNAALEFTAIPGNVG